MGCILLDPKLYSKVLTAIMYPSNRGKLCQQSANMKMQLTEFKSLSYGEMYLAMRLLTTNRTWLFQKKYLPMMACLIPGHFEAGMKGQIVVQETAGAKKTLPSAKTNNAHDHSTHKH